MKTIEIVRKLISQPFGNLEEFTKELNRLCDIVENEQDNDREMRQVADLRLNKLPHCTVISEQCKVIAENEALRKQLENSVQLPCKVGDTIYEIRVGNRLEGNCILEHKVREIIIETNIDTGKQHYYLVCGKNFNEYFWEERYKNYWFSNKPEAEARLKELQGVVI